MGDSMDTLDGDDSSGTFDVCGNEEKMDCSESTSHKFQKESIFLRHLPYYDELKEETTEYLDKMILNLARTVICQDFQLGVNIYTKTLRSYIHVYGRKFTKEQHIKLVNLYMELLTMETCPLNIISSIAEMLNTLLRKPELLTRDDLCIPWRPLLETLDRAVIHRKYTLSFNASAKIEALLKETIRLSNVYFEKNTFAEVVAEFKPLLCPTSPKMVYGIEMMKHFLPFLDPDAEKDINELIVHLIGYSDGWNNHPTWEWTMMSLFATAAWNMPGSFDWTPYLPTMYARLMKNLELPVHFKGGKNAPRDSGVKTYEYGSAARWIVSTLGNNPVALKHLCNFLKSLETYFNPLNHGRWTMPLGSLLSELVSSFTHRLKKERYMDNKKRWWYRIPDERKLTDDDIDKFVKTTSYIVLDFYLDVNTCGMVLKNLASIRPQFIIPAVMEKYEGIVETLTEPRKYMTALRWVTIIMMPLVGSRNSVEGYDGRKLVLPFAMSLLPAIDPNDMYKTLSALGCIHGLFSLFPIVDCSALVDTVEDEDEKQLCLETACIEDFVVQFFDRILALVESRSVENTRMSDNRHINEGSSVEDVSLEKFLWAVAHRVANQASTPICKAVIKKLTSFALGSTLETGVSGKLFASILQAFVAARPDIALPKLLPPLCSSVVGHITNEILDEEDLDKSLLFQLLLLSYVMETSGPELMKYKSEIESLLTAVLKLNGKKAYGFTSHILSRLIQSLVYIYPAESKLSEHDYDDPNYLAINDWGISTDPKKVNCYWHVPSQEENEWAECIFLKVFVEYSGKLESAATLSESNEDFNKYMLKNLQILLAAYNGINTVLKFWDDVPVQLDETVADLRPDNMRFGLIKRDMCVPGTDKLITKRYYELYCDVLGYLQKYKSDDTDAFLALMKGFDSLIIPHVESERRYVPVPAQKTASVSASIQNTLDPKKKYTRGGIIVRAFDIHMKRIRAAGFTTWTKSHIEVMHKLFLLCINHYARVRVNAQNRFFRIMDSVDGLVARTVTHFFDDYLKEGAHHDEYKGTLYTLLGRGFSPLIHNSWEGIVKLWLDLVHSPFSEKNSIIKIMEKIKNTVTQAFIYYPLQSKVPVGSKVKECATALLTAEQLAELGPLEIIQTPENLNHFTKLVDGLTASGVDGNVHWRRQVMCVNMLSTLIIDDPSIPTSPRMVEILFEGLVSHSIDIRKTAMTTISWLLVLFKRQYTTVSIDTKIGLKLTGGESVHSMLQYKSRNGEDPKKETVKWSVPQGDNGHPSIDEVFIHKIHYGFSGLPAAIKQKLPVHDYSDFSTNQSESRKIVLETTMKYFGSEEYIKKLLDIWSLEEKGKSKNSKKAAICKTIARNNGPEALKIILKETHALGTDTDQWKQRCAADVICGIIYGMKLWDEKTTEDFWTILKPIFSSCLDSVTQETLGVWSTALAYPTLNRDPNKMRFFIEFLRERFVKSLETSQTTSVDAFKEITFFEQAISNIQWRGGDVFFETLNLVKKHFFDTPIPYMNVRVQLGRLLSDVFEWDVESPVKMDCEFCPKYEPFVEFLFLNLESLEEQAAKYQANEKDSESNAEIRKLLLKFKTVLEWILSVCWDNESSVPPSFFRFIPLLCNFESYDPDPEIAQLSGVALSGLARTLISPKYLELVLRTLDGVANSPSWKSRLCVLEFLKVFALNNTSVFASSEKWSNLVVTLVMKLLSDRKLEVRELASQVLCGFLHCLLIKEPMELLKTFQKTAASFKVKRQKARDRKREPLSPEEIDAGHSAILGLCAFVDTHPYHVPIFLPDVLVVLTTHLHDPQPIPATIRKCLSNFRRTHHDNWSVHKMKFTEDQLCILTDIFVSPCYYA